MDCCPPHVVQRPELYHLLLVLHEIFFIASPELAVSSSAALVEPSAIT